MTVVLLIAALVTILASCEFFTNGVEWVGHKLNLGEGVVGSILAAVGTAMPETLIPIIAIVFSGAGAAEEIGIGAILGAPFMLATSAMFIAGVAVLIFSSTGRRIQQMNVNHVILSRDMTFFFIAFTIALGTVFVPHSGIRLAISAGLLIIYAIYVFRQFSHESEGGQDLNPLHLSRAIHATREKLNPSYAEERVDRIRSTVDAETIDVMSPLLHTPPRLVTAVLQTLIGLGGIVAGARLFVSSVDVLAHDIAIPAIVLSFIIAPIATELPESLNVFLWTRRGKDTLAMGNITGAMVFQACIPTAIAIAITSWSIEEGNQLVFLSAIIAMISAAIIFGVMRIRGKLTGKWLLLGGLFYAAYLAAILTR